MSEKKFWCGNCRNGWVRNIDCENHFSLEMIKVGCKLVENKCYKAKRRCVASTLHEAEQNLKSKTLFYYMPTQSSTSSPPSKCSTHGSSSSLCTPTPHISEPINVDLSDIAVSSTFTQQSTSSKQPSFEQGAECTSASKDCTSKFEEILTAINSLSIKVDKVHTRLDKSNIGETFSSTCETQLEEMPSDKQYAKYLGDIRSSRIISVKMLLANPLVKDVFLFYLDNNDDGLEVLICGPCSKWGVGESSSTSKSGIKLLDGSEYSVWETGLKRPMTRTFSNLKITVAKHVETHTHKRALEKEFKETIATNNTKKDIFNSMLYLSYFSVKSNLPFQLFENLFGTVGICGLELGDINHSVEFINKFMSLLDVCLIKKNMPMGQ